AGTLPTAEAQLALASVRAEEPIEQEALTAPSPAQAASAPQPAQRSPMPDGLIHTEAPQPANVFIQAGSFTEYQNASQLAARLQPHGYVQIEPTAVSGQSFYRVRIGPVESVDEADVLLARLI